MNQQINTNKECCKFNIVSPLPINKFSRKFIKCQQVGNTFNNFSLLNLPKK